MAWTEDMVDLLKRRWREGMNAREIAMELGGVSRNAVIGKVFRLGLSNPTIIAPKPQEEAKTVDKTKAAAPKTKKQAAPAKNAKPAAAPSSSARRKIIPADQPLPPQPNPNEIAPEALETAGKVEKKAKRIKLMELTKRTCKWPIGDPATEDFWFCGHPVQVGKPYCEAHVGVAFQPMTSRADRRR